jgi:hypothetical protein
MKLVVSAETERPPRLTGQAWPTASVATEALSLNARVADPLPRGHIVVQASEHLLEVLPQLQQLLGQLVQSWLG